MLTAKRPPSTSGVPAWFVTYADLMTLLLCVFVCVVSMSTVNHDRRFHSVLQSIRGAFGHSDDPSSPETIGERPTSSLMQRLQEIELSRDRGKEVDAKPGDVRAAPFRVESTSDGLHITISGPLCFGRDDAELLPPAKDLLATIAELVGRSNGRILVRGHATEEPQLPTSASSDVRELSFARAKAAADELEQHGVPRTRVVLAAVGANEPLVRHAFTDDRRALNRRIELVVKEDDVHDVRDETGEIP